MNFAGIAFRNLSRQKRRSFLLASAIAFGIFIVTFVNCLSAGTVRVLQENFADMIGGHVFVAVEEKVGDRTVAIIKDDVKLIAAIKSLGVTDDQISRTVDAERSEMIFNGKSERHILIGVDWQNDKSGTSRKLGLDADTMTKLAQNPNSIVVSKKTADNLKLVIGDSVIFKSQTVTGQQNVADYTVGYITGDTSEFGGMIVFVSKPAVTALVNLPEGAYLNIRIRLNSLDEAPAFAIKLKELLKKEFALKPPEDSNFSFTSSVFKMNAGGNFTGQRVDVTTINDMLSVVNQFSSGLSLVSIIVLVVLLLITMIGIANTFRMIMYERTKEIGTMRALGMHQSEVKSIFLAEAVFLSLVGVAIGNALALVAILLTGLMNFGTDSFVAIILQNGHLNFTIAPGSMIISTVLVVVLTLVAALGPANKASKLEPAEALRSNY